MKKSLLPIIGLLLITGCAHTTPTPTVVATRLATPLIINSPSPTVTVTPTPLPTQTPTPYPLVKPQIAAGDYHTCYLSASGRVTCWGWNPFGQAGSGSSEEQILPGEWIDLQGITQISAGEYHTCAVDANHQVFCWGRNNMGQLGTGDTMDSRTPVKVRGLNGAKIGAVVTGSVHTCAYEHGGKAWCWGSNRDGKLGIGENIPYTTIPKAVNLPVDNVITMSAGATFTCAASATGQTWCWGDGFFGETGDRLLAVGTSPKEIRNPVPEIIQLTSGWFHSCAMTKNGDIFCWGKNLEGELGNSSTVSRADPVNVSGITGKQVVYQISAGGMSSCAVTSENKIFCWGRNNFGQIGDGSTKDRLFPVQVPSGGQNIAGIAVGASHACYLTDSGQIWCWGANDHQQLGAVSPSLSLSPLQIDIPSEVK